MWWKYIIFFKAFIYFLIILKDVFSLSDCQDILIMNTIIQGGNQTNILSLTSVQRLKVINLMTSYSNSKSIFFLEKY